MSTNSQIIENRNEAIKAFFESVSLPQARKELNNMYTSYLMDEERNDCNDPKGIALENVNTYFVIDKIVDLLYALGDELTL